MTRAFYYRLGPSDRIAIDGKILRDPKRAPQGYVFRDDKARNVVEYSDVDIAEAVDGGRIRVDRDYYAPAQWRSRALHCDPPTDELDDEQKRQLHWRVRFCQEFLRMERKKRATRDRHSMAKAIAEINQTLSRRRPRRVNAKLKNDHTIGPPSTRTLLRWLKKYEANSGGELNLRYLYRRMGNKHPRFDTATYTIMNRHAAAYAHETRPTIQKCYDAFTDEMKRTNQERQSQNLPRLCVPSRTKFASVIRAQNRFEQVAKREGLATAQKRFYAAKGGLDVTHPLERVEIDEWNVPLFSLLSDQRIFEQLSPDEIKKLERTRFWVTVIVDVATRYVLSIILSPTPSPKSALKALKIAMSDKTRIAKAYGASSAWEGRGLPFLLAADNGASLIDADFRETVVRLGITILYTLAGLPQLRATIEREFRTLTLEAIAPFTGRTFENPVRRGDYPAEARAALTVEELAQALTLAVVDVYHNKPHSGLYGETPLNAWRRLVERYGAPPPPDRLKMIVEFGIAARAKTGVEGVRHANFWYHSVHLQQHRMRHGDGYVEIRTDPDLLDAIAVKIGEDWVLVPAVDQELSTVSLLEWKRESAYLRKLFASQAEVSRPIVMEAVEKLRAIGEHAIARAGITPTLVSDGALRAAAENTLIGFSIVDPADGIRPPEETPSGFLSKQIPTGETEHSRDRATADDPPRSAPRSPSWRIEE